MPQFLGSRILFLWNKDFVFSEEMCRQSALPVPQHEKQEHCIIGPSASVIPSSSFYRWGNWGSQFVAVPTLQPRSPNFWLRWIKSPTDLLINNKASSLSERNREYLQSLHGRAKKDLSSQVLWERDRMLLLRRCDRRQMARHGHMNPRICL